MTLDPKDEWPYQPDHITDIRTTVFADKTLEKSLQKLTGKGILAYTYVQGIQAAISEAIQLPTTLVEFAPKGELIRTDSPALATQMTLACTAFRGYFNKIEQPQWCINTDFAHARLLYEDDGFRSIEALKQSIVAARENPSKKKLLGDGLDAKQYRKRCYLSYQCKWIGYHELVFPIIVEHRLLAAFFVGQIFLEGEEKRIEKQILSLSKPQSVCNSCAGTSCDPIPEEVIKEILNRHREWVGKKENVHPNISQLVHKACVHLEAFEANLEENLEHRRYRYINRNVSHLIDNFSHNLPREITSPQDSLKALWKNAEKAINSIAKNFSREYLVVFGVRNITATSVHELQVVATSKRAPALFKKKESRDRIKLDLNDIQLDFKNGEPFYISRYKYPEVLRALKLGDKAIEPETLDSGGDFDLVFLPVPLHRQSSIAILVGYTKALPLTVSENGQEGHLKDSLRAFYTLLSSATSATLAGIEERLEDDQRRVLYHEVMQQSAGIEWTIEAIKRTPGKFYENISKNLSTFVNNIELLYKGVNSIFQKELSSDFESFDIYQEILFKWQDLCRLEARRKDLEIRTTYKDIPEAMRPEVYGDRALLEQLMYNLVNNAVKYCHRGTRVILDCQLAPQRSGHSHLLSVTDYGPEMKKGRELYGLYVRGTRAKSGQGIGLYLCDRIAEQHNGKMYHTSQLISNFNVALICPFLRAFKHNRPLWVTDELYKQVEEEYLRLQEQMKEIIALDERQKPMFRPEVRSARLVEEAEFKSPTYEVKVIVELPRKRAE
jgi:hypothetical protein